VVAAAVTATVVLLAVLAESLHARRVHRVANLAFGPSGRPAMWARAAGGLRVAALGALAWGLTTLLHIDPKLHIGGEEIPDHEKRNLVIVLDVSPSMRLKDAGPDHKQTRMQRARDVLDSMFARVGIRQYLISVIATYNGAIPVVEKSHDPEVLRNAMDDLPMHYAFPKGSTDLFAGISHAVKMARPYHPGSTTLLLVTDGDTVPATGMPKLPASIAHTVVIGVGDSRQGTFIDGRHSRQEASTLRQIAIRLGGVYHDGNEKHISSDVIKAISQSGGAEDLDRLTLREYALLASALGAAVLAFLPLALQQFGTLWSPGTSLVSADAPEKPRRTRRRVRKTELVSSA
jgi:Ca-activated chloride channel homolog